MADPFTLIQSIVQVSSACYILGKFFYTLQDDYNNVDERAQSLSRQMQNLSVTLDSMRAHFEQPATEALLLGSERDANYWANVLLILQDCAKTVGNMETKINEVRRGDAEGKRSKAGRLMRMYFAQSEIEFYRKEIEGYSNALSLSLHMISISTAIGNRELTNYTTYRLDSLTENVNSAMLILKKLEKRSRHLSLTPPAPVDEKPAEDPAMTTSKATNLSEYITSATRIVSSASTIIETQSTREASTEYEFGSEVDETDLLPPERKKAIAKWIEREDNNSNSGGSSGEASSVHYPFASSTLGGMSSIGEDVDEEEAAENLDVLQNLVKLGKANFENEDYARAQKYLEVAKDMLLKKQSDPSTTAGGCEREHQEHAAQLAEILDTLSDSYRRQKMYEECYQTLKELEGIPMRSELASLSLKHDIAEMCLQTGKYSEGREYCEAALRGRQSSLGLRNKKSFESVSLITSILYANGESALADAYKISLPASFQSSVSLPEGMESSASLNTVTQAHEAPQSGAASVMTVSPPPSYYTARSNPNATPTLYGSGTPAANSSLSVATTLYRPITASFNEVSAESFIRVCDHVDALRAAGRHGDAGREGVGYLKYITKDQKWSYWEAWDLIREHIAHFGMNGGSVGRSPLHVLCYCGLHDLVKALIDRGATVNGRARGMKTALHIAAGINARLVGLLVDSGAEVEAADKSRWTALHHAAYHGRFDSVKVLVDKGAEVDARNDRGQTAAMIARALKKKDIAKYLDPSKGSKIKWFRLAGY